MPKDLRDMTLREVYAEYYTTVRAIAEESAVVPDDDRSDYINEAVEGSEWIIYTYRAKLVSLESENADAIFDALGDEGTHKPEQIAYYAMCADVESEVAHILAQTEAVEG